MSTSDEIVIDDGKPQEVASVHAADLAARIRAELETVLVPGASVSAEDISAGLAKFLASAVAVGPDIKVTVDPADPTRYSVRYILRTAEPVYTLTMTKPEDMSEETWRAFCAELEAGIEQGDADGPILNQDRSVLLQPGSDDPAATVRTAGGRQ